MERISIKECKRQARTLLAGNWKKMLLIMLVMLVCTSFAVSAVEEIITALDADAVLEWTQLTENEHLMNNLDISELFVKIPKSMYLIPLFSLIVGVFSPMISYGSVLACAKLMKGEEPKVKMLFCWKMFWKTFAMNFIRKALMLLAAFGMAIGGTIFALVLNGSSGIAVMILVALLATWLIIVMMMRWSMAEYIWTENENFGASEVLHESASRMKGYKGTGFLLSLSFMGWMTLFVLAAYAVNMLQNLMFEGSALSLISDAALILLQLPLSVYMMQTSTVFYGEVNSRCQKGVPEAEMENEIEDDDENETSMPIQGLPPADIPENLQPMTAEETAAYGLLVRHDFSRRKLEQNGLLSECLKYNLHPVTEARWQRDYMERLAEKYSENREVLKDILAITAEYGSTYGLDIAINLVDRGIWTGSQPADALREQCAALRQTLESPAFSDIPNVVSGKQAQIADMENRL